MSYSFIMFFIVCFAKKYQITGFTIIFCGTRKSRVIREVVLNQKKDLSIIVFPYLALIRQYTNYYLQDIQARKSHKIFDISSDILDYFTITTDPLKIKKFLKLKKYSFSENNCI